MDDSGFVDQHEVVTPTKPHRVYEQPSPSQYSSCNGSDSCPVSALEIHLETIKLILTVRDVPHNLEL
eukprot:m.179092 g.179092  ORF g.179092 m.179092 type:complete len:67 (+) comp15473_c0_seq5:604-804(+)